MFAMHKYLYIHILLATISITLLLCVRMPLYLYYIYLPTRPRHFFGKSRRGDHEAARLVPGSDRPERRERRGPICKVDQVLIQPPHLSKANEVTPLDWAYLRLAEHSSYSLNAPLS